MDAAVQRFIDTEAEKVQTKLEVMKAIGQRFWHASQAEGDDAYAKEQQAKVAELDDFISANGHETGREGMLQQSLQEQANEYVAAHPEQFALFASLVRDGEVVDPATNTTGHDRLVALISRLREAHMTEEVALLTMFELAKFERQHIGATNRAKLKLGGND